MGFNTYLVDIQFVATSACENDPHVARLTFSKCSVAIAPREKPDIGSVPPLYEKFPPVALYILAAVMLSPSTMPSFLTTTVAVPAEVFVLTYTDSMLMLDPEHDTLSAVLLLTVSRVPVMSVVSQPEIRATMLTTITMSMTVAIRGDTPFMSSD